MRIDIPVLYDAIVVPANHRSPRSMTFRDRIAVDVPEVSEAEAPVAATNLRSNDLQGSQLRWHDGTVWIADRPYERVTDLAEWSRSLFSDRPLSQSWKALHDGRSNNLPDMQGSPADMRRCDRDGHAEALAKTREYASGLLLVDGLLHARVDPPVAALWDLGIDHDGVPQTFVAFVSGAPARHFSSHDWSQRPTDFYSLCRQDDLVAHAEAHYGGLGGNVTWPEILIPEAFSDVPDEEWSLHASAALAVEALTESLPSLDCGSGSLWFRVRDAVESPEPDYDALYGLMRELAQGLDPARGRNSVADAYRVEKAHRMAVKSCDRWEMRPLDLPAP